MGTFLDYTFNSEFPFDIFEYTTVGAKDKPHSHDYLQIGLCTEGEGKFLFGDKEYDVSKGDIFVVNNFEQHVAVTEDSSYTKYLFLVFRTDFILSSGNRIFDYEYLSPFWYDMDKFCNKIDRKSNIAESIGKIMVEIKGTLERREVGYKHLVDADVRKILAILINFYRTFESDGFKTKINHKIKMKPALDYIHKHFKDSLKLKDVASTIYMSESRFRHLFKETNNIGFKEYVTYLRINEAKKILITTNKGINELVLEVGWKNVYQFYKIFKKYVYMTPAEYRNYFKGRNIGDILSEVDNSTSIDKY